MSIMFTASNLIDVTINGESFKEVRWVFKDSELTEILSWEKEETPVYNPEYRPEFDITLANGNARIILKMLGYQDDDCGTAPIDEALTRAQECLGNPNLSCAYRREKISAIHTMLLEGKGRGATHLSWA